MISPESLPATAKSVDPPSRPRISFSANLHDDEDDDDANFISINPHNRPKPIEKPKTNEFEFLSSNFATTTTMLTADELFFEGKLLPFGHKQCAEKLGKMSVKSDEIVQINEIAKGEEAKLGMKLDVVKSEESNRISWFIDEDPSPRPPKCTVLWKELLRLRKHRASSLSASSSTSSSSSSSSSIDEDPSKKVKSSVKRVKKGLERTRSGGIKIRPMVNLPVCSQGVRSNSLPPLYSGSRKGGMLER
ncbi:hypothetical protein SSX86_009463 [Deinandra increscens subsp. villosa]|uniref:Uncharacterized protein n=1 Tax=Deinandra increscens subsp. villosa TaxID=3103831 RepID=A0AAP0DDE2_9ASTR